MTLSCNVILPTQNSHLSVFSVPCFPNYASIATSPLNSFNHAFWEDKLQRNSLHLIDELPY